MALSVQNFRAAMAVPTALGLDPTVANSVYQVINSGVSSILPSGIQRAILNGIFTIGRAKLSESILNEYNPLGWSRLAKLRRIFEEGRSLQLQFPAEDLGFRYLEGMVVPDSDSAPQEAPSGHRRDYIPTADPGCRLPHMTMMVFSSSSSKETISTPDLISIDNVEFLLIIAPKASSYHLARASLTVAEELKVPIKVCIIWSSDPIEGTKAPLAPCKNYIDVLEVRKSPTLQSWWDICKMREKGAILVRPDEHIAWRAKSEVFGDPSQEMTRVLKAVLGPKSISL